MRAPSPADLQRLALLIEAEAIQLREFVALLEHEEALLVAGDTDALLTLTKDKTDRYRQLQRLADDKALHLGRLGRSNADASIRELCAGLPRVLARWDEVLELARNARERNTLNGKLITERMQHNQAALSVLLSAANHPQLYDAAGQTRPTGGGRILGSA
ncbi:putative flagellar synthesis chaperone [Azoarcus olearius]|uniref:flagella synthesis protein FlgN n=1 Tax=Azoarcus sp. (strain BH72) TaxID=418699 RepID=UPI00080620B8|nr:flagellar protein FlgN [Azoarcus olearius]ANQ85906.1 putative flagellar synthesis chaperone [Azoarcus olearius]